MSIILILIIVSIFLTAGGQLMLKMGMAQIGHFDFNIHNLLPIMYKVVTNLPILGGLFIYFISLAIWLMVLSRAEVSFAYPLISMGYIINALAAYYWFGENLTPTRILGICIVITGVFLIARS